MSAAKTTLMRSRKKGDLGSKDPLGEEEAEVQCPESISIPCRGVDQQDLAGKAKGSGRNWFEEANAAVVSQENSMEVVKDDPPFFLGDLGSQHAVSSISPVHDDAQPFIVPSVERDDENEEWDWRGIIDDLTVEIKQLKRKLRQYCRTRPRQLRKDTVFELRTYGLSTDKKRQLEEILRDFAADVEWQSNSAKPDHVTGFNSGTSSNFIRKHVTRSRAVRTISAIESSAPRKSRYDSYTSHVEVTESSDIIQNTMVPRQGEESKAQSNMDKMKLMASILESTLQHQISVPKKTLPLPESQATNSQKPKTQNAKDTSGKDRTLLENSDHDGSNVAPGENPSGENIWDLDQLVRAAQSVVLEMNRDLAQRSLQSHSKTLEVSNDGHRVRRKATSAQLHINQHHDRDEISSNASTLPEVKVTTPPQETTKEKSRPKPGWEKTLPLGLTKQPHPARGSSVGSSSRPVESPFYKPSLVSGQGSGESDITMSSNTSSSEQDSDMADISTDTSWSNQSRPHSCDHCKKPIEEPEHPHNGTVTFYRQAPFCVDLSRDGSSVNGIESQNAKSAEAKCNHHHHLPPDKVPAKYSAYSKEEPTKPWNVAEDSDASPFGLDIKPLSSTPHKKRSQPIDLEASGVGEVLPADNFAIHVDVKHVPTVSPEPSSSNGEASSSGSSRNPPERRYDGQILSTEREELDPSALPPATCAFFSSDDDLSDSGDESDDFDL